MTEFNEPASSIDSPRESRANPRSFRPGGLTRAVASCPGLANLHNSANPKEPIAILRPKPTRVCMPTVEEPVDCFPGFGSYEAAERELRNLLASRNSPPVGSTPGLGVSPPLRTGALNPLGNSPSWMTAAPAACRTHLRLLEELQSQATPVPGDANLLMVSPEGGHTALLSTAVATEDSHLNTLGPTFKPHSPQLPAVLAPMDAPRSSVMCSAQNTGRCSPSINFGISSRSSSSAREIQPLRC